MLRDPLSCSFQLLSSSFYSLSRLFLLKVGQSSSSSSCSSPLSPLSSLSSHRALIVNAGLVAFVARKTTPSRSVPT